MKKFLLAVLVLSLTVCCFAAVVTASAATDIAVSSTPSERGYFKYKSFEDFEAGISSASAVYAANTLTWATDDDGNHALATVQGDNGYPGQIFSLGTSSNEGTYYVEFDIKPVKNVVAATVLFGIPQGGNGNFFAQIGLSFNSDLTSIEIADGASVGGWPVVNYKNATIQKLENGYWHVYFEYDVTAEMNSATALIFCQRATVGGDNEVRWDNISYGNIANEAEYYNIDWNVDYGTLTNVWSEQPIWANTGTVVADYFDTGVSALKIEGADLNNGVIGGMNNADGSAIKVSKNPVMTYFQFDINLEGLTMINFWTHGGEGLWTELQYDGGAWKTNNSLIQNLSVTNLEKGWRLSYFIDMSASTNPNIDFRINASGTGAAYIANFLVAQIDTVRAPWISTDTVTYNAKELNDVYVNLDTKGREITSLKCGDEDVDAANWSYTGETLTVKGAAFDGKSGDLTFTATTEGGSVNFEVKQEQTKEDVTVTLVSDKAINKYFDGTTDVNQAIEFDIEGVEEGHDVKVNYVAAYDSETAGTDKTITITLTLAGNDAYLYELINDTLQITGCEIYALAEVTVSYDGEPVEKYFDGTTEVKSTIELTLAGIAQGDEVNVTFDAVYAGAEAGEVKINITNVVLTGKDAYKYTLTESALQIDGVITERTTVTPTFNGLVEKRYDGTSYIDTKTFTLSLNGIEQGDEVTVTFSAEFDGIDAGERKVNVYNITLSGKDAHKYELGATTLQLDGYIAEMKDIAISDDRGYYTMDGQTLLSWDFENEKAGDEVAANAIDGLYLSPDGGEVGIGVEQKASIIDDNGNMILKIEENCLNTSTQLFSTNTTGNYRSAGIYAVSYKVKPQNASIIGVLVRNAYINNATGILADFRYVVSYDTDGKAVSVTKETQGWLGENQKISNASAKLDEDGWITCYFEFELTDGIVFGDAYCPVVIFTGASAVNGEISNYYFDDIKYIHKSTSNKYMTIDHEYDMEGVNGEVATNTPFYTDLEDGFVYDSDWTEGVDNTVIRLDIPANNSEQVGALKNSVADGEYKLFKGEGVHYVQFDFDMTCASFNLFSLNFFDLQCTNGDEYTFKLEVYNGIINNFKTVKVENGMTRVSFAVDMTGLDYDATYLNLKATTGSVGGEIYFDNLFVSREDYTPVTSDAKYNFVNTQDVKLDLYLKGARLLGVELDGEPLDTGKFAFDAETEVLTLDKSLFITSNTNASDRVIKIKTSQGDILAKASIVDNRPNVTLDLNYTGDAIAKDYDGTTDVDKAVVDAVVGQIVMNGVATGDDVTFTYDIAFASKNAGPTTIIISNIVLGGADAGNYVLTTSTLTVEAAINKIQLTVSGTKADNKVYDGTTTATATAGTLGGVLTGETVTLNVATAAFNSKNVAEANKVTVTYTLSGEDAINYIAPVSQELTNVSITKKTVTVTADAKTITIGESEPTLTYNVTGLVDGETLSGTLTREQGNEVGEYDILQGTLSAGDNYELTYVGAKLTVKATDPVTDDPVDEPKDGLSVGAIVGIVAACVAVVGAAAAAAIIVIKKRRSK